MLPQVARDETVLPPVSIPVDKEISPVQQADDGDRDGQGTVGENNRVITECGGYLSEPQRNGIVFLRERKVIS